LEVRGKPILDWILGSLPRAVERVVVVVHYLANQVEDFMRSQRHIPQWVTVFQENPRGTGDALRACQPYLHTERFLVLNGDDLYGAKDLAALARHPAGLLVHPVDEPRRFGIAFLRPDGTLDRLVEKPDLDGRQLANTGAYVFPREVFNIELKLSPRGEYEITDYLSTLASRQPVQVVQANFWLPIGTVEVWRKAEQQKLEEMLLPRTD
jgi:bifunctional UDP-N-acetylglucosamine pyrophosphorylase/glucosamine-1-phosphate N-acetyltransferase